MITLPLPDKYIRKALFTLINNIEVNGETITIHDSKITGSTIPSHYILMTTQTNSTNERVKCGDRWDSSILLDIVTRYGATGNTGSRLLADDIAEAVRKLLENKLVLSDDLNIITQKLNFPDDITSETDSENIFRKFIRIELTIN